MQKSIRCVRRVLCLLLAVWLTFVPMMIPTAQAAQTEIALEYTLPDGLRVQLTAPVAAFAHCDAQTLFLEVQEEIEPQAAQADFVAALAAVTQGEEKSTDTRVFTVRVRQKVVPEESAAVSTSNSIPQGTSISAAQSNSQSVSQSGSQSGSQSASQSASQSVSQSASQSVSQSASQSVSQSVSQSASQSDSISAAQSNSQSASQSVSQSDSISAVPVNGLLSPGEKVSSAALSQAPLPISPESVEIKPQEAVTLSFILPTFAPENDAVKIYQKEETSGALQELPAQIKDAREVSVQTGALTSFVMVSPTAPRAADLTAVTITMNWFGGNAAIRPNSSTVRLYGNNIEVPQSAVTLSDANQWKHVWNNLPVKNSSGIEIQYVVSQDPMPNVIPEMQYLNDVVHVFLPAEQIENGGTYLFADGISVMASDSGNAQNIRAIPISFTSAMLNGVNTRVAEMPEAAARWNAVQNTSAGTSFYLKNNATTYLSQYKNDWGLPTSLGTVVSNTAQNQTAFTYMANKTLASDAGTWVVRNGSRFLGLQSAAQATPLQLYRQVPVDLKIHIANRYVPPTPSDGGKVEYHKRIDFLGDGAGNPDTALRGKDDYRLYLDVASSIQMPADLVLVLDVSGSMDASRMTVLNNALMGQDGFIARFLKADPQNHLGIVYFWGARTPNWSCAVNWATDNPLVNGIIQSGNDIGDATIYQNWITAANLPYQPVLLKKGVGGTNYGAGLYQAQRLFNMPPSNPSPTKYMVFMSDGVPTHALSTRTAGQTNGQTMNTVAVFGQRNIYVPQSLRPPTGIYRYGSGEGASGNPEFCKEPNITLARNFTMSNPDLNIFSVGVDVTDSTVLENLASGTGRYLNAVDFDALDATFSSILGPHNVVITDTLSEYVNLAAGDTVQVKLTAKSGTNTKTLWANGAITADGNGIVQSVVVDAATQKVTASFVPSFTLAPNTVYTLSFNVRVNQKAYDTYALQGYPVSGDVDTDYAQNTTSSQRPGFYANNNAQAALHYLFGTVGNAVTKLYQKPVVQVSEAEIKLRILKTDDTTQKNPLQGAEFDLFRAVYDTANKVWKKAGVRLGNVVTDGTGKAVFAAKLLPGHYFLVETKAPPNCQPLQSDILVKLDGEQGTVVQGKAVIHPLDRVTWQLTIPNTRRVALPATGGSGTQNFYLAGGGLILWAVMLRRRKEGDAAL